MVCSSTHISPSNFPQNALKSVRLTKRLVCDMLHITKSTCLPGISFTLFRLSTWWMKNCDSSDQDTFFHRSMVQSRWFWVPCKPSYRRRLVNTWVWRLLSRSKPKCVCWTVRSKTIVHGSAFYLRVILFTIWLDFDLPSGTFSDVYFPWWCADIQGFGFY